MTREDGRTSSSEEGRIKLAVDWFTASFGAVEIEAKASVLGTVSAAWEDYLRAGGSLDYGQWQAASADTKTAMIAAGNRLRLEQAVQIARAMAAYPPVLDDDEEAAH